MKNSTHKTKQIRYMIASLLLLMYSNSAYSYVYAIIDGSSDVYIKAQGNKNVSGEIEIPAQVELAGKTYTVVGIGECAFGGTRITSIHLPNTIKYIGREAFNNCTSLTSLELPNSLDSLGRCFIMNSGITHIKIPNSVTKIVEYAFAYSKLESIDITELSPFIKQLPRGSFFHSNLKKITIPNTVTSIGEEAFMCCDSLKSVEFSENLTSIGSYAFSDCIALEEINLSEQLKTFGTDVFARTNLKSVTLPKSLKVIQDRMFFGCQNLESIKIPTSIIIIGKSAFESCRNLTSIVLSDSLQEIRKNAFVNTGLKSIILPKNLSSMGEEVFDQNVKEVESKILEPFHTYAFSSWSGGHHDRILYVPYGTKEKYINCYGWGNYFKEIIEREEIFIFAIESKGDGFAFYCDTIRSQTKTLTVKRGNTACISFYPDSGYRIKSVVVNGTDVTSGVTNNQYTISNISQDITVVVTFEAIPTTLTLSATSLSLTSSETNNRTITATVSPTTAIITAESSDTNICTVSVSGTGVTRTISITPKENTGTSQRTATITVTAMANGQSATKTISVTQAGVPGSAPVIAAFSIHDVTSTSFSYSMTFTANPATTEYGVCYSSTNTRPTNADNRNSWTEHISGSTVSSTVNNLTPGTTYYIRAYATNSYGTTYSSNVQTVTIPPTTYTLTIQSSGSGTVNCLGYTVSGGTKNIPISESSSATLTITPNDGNRIKSVLVNGTDVTPNVTNNQCAITISNISQNTTVIVTFEAIPTTLTLSATSLSLTSSETNERTITATVSPITAIITTESSDTNICTVSVSGTGATRTITITPKENTGTSQRTSTITVTATANGQTATKTILVTQAGVPGSAPEITAFNVYDVTRTSFYFSMTFTANPAATEYGVCYSTTNTIPNSSTFRFRWTSPSTGITTSSYVTENLTPGATYYVCAYATNSYGTAYSNVQTVTIPPTNYTLSITSIGNGYVSYSRYTINETAKSYAVSEGSSATLTFTPNDGYRIKSVLVNGTDVISGVTNSQYTISNINQDVSVVVTFEAIPTTLTLSVTSLSLTSSETNNKIVTATVSPTNATVTAASSNTNICTVSVSGTGATRTITITPKENMGISQRTATITVTATANGETATKTVSVTQAGVPGSAPVITAFNVYDVTRTSFYFSMTFTANPAATTYGICYSTTNSVPNSTTYWSSWSSPSTGRTASSYVTDNLTPGTTYYVRAYATNSYGTTYSTDIKTVTIPPALTGMTVDGVNYKVNSYNGKTVNVATGDYGKVLNVPAAFGYEGDTWTVTGIESGALTNATDLAAVIWNPSVAFTERANNPNLLLYVTSASYAPSSAKNVIVNNVAQTITLTETSSGNDFYCPRSFTARTISYSHRYQMTTGIDDCQGWETIALPFDVQTISHESKGGVAPFAVRTSSQKGFWLYELTSSGWKVASAIKANTPYIISMPNNELYFDAARLNGRITFSAANVSVPMTKENTVSYRGRTFVPSFMHQARSGGIYALNVKNEWYTTNGTEGSLFVANLRDVSPFEAYMTTTNNSRGWFGIFDDTPTDIRGVEELIDTKRLGIYNLNGQKVKNAEFESVDELKQALPAGVYIINGHKVIVR